MLNKRNFTHFVKITQNQKSPNPLLHMDLDEQINKLKLNLYIVMI